MVLMIGSLASAFAQTQNPNPPPKPTPPPGVVFDERLPPPSDNYPLGPDSVRHPDVAAGSSFHFDITESNIFPNTSRTITVYIPAAYTGDHPACVYVGLDGLGFNAPVVFDNLIAQHAMPVTIAIGISPGAVASSNEKEDPRFDRSMEFDSRSERLARFLLEEVLPAVQRHQTPAGKPILLSSNPNDRAIGGSSTDGIGAFTVAWERPDAFRRVFISIGTFVGMRGGEQYYVLVRKTEPKPLRIFMQDGVYDQWGGGPEIGDWWMSNRTMERALSFAGYDVNHVWGTGSHNGSQAAQIFPDAMRWLWRDWPTPIAAAPPGNPILKAILKPGEAWQIAAEGCAPGTSLAAEPHGQVFFNAAPATAVGSIPTPCNNQAYRPAAIQFSPDSKLYAALPNGGIAIRGGATVAGNLHIAGFTVRSSGDIYATDTMGELWLITAAGKQIRLDENIKGPAGLAPSPDGLWLFVAQNLSRSGLSYRLLPDGTVDAREPFFDFAIPAWADDPGATAVAMDRDGRPYVGTRMGVQVFDRNGRVTAILPLPNHEPVTGLCFGGEDFSTLYVTSGSTIYKRKLATHGAPPWADPIKLPPWGGG
jgi:enterochelin esterase-like enzyme